MKHLLAALTLSSPLLLAGCATTADESDSSPPEVVLRYRFEGGTWVDVPGSGLELDFEDEVLHLWAVGTDSGGVRLVEIEVSGDVVCQSGLPKYSHSPSVVEQNSEDPSVEDGGRTVSSRNVVMEFPASRACEDEAHDLKSGTLVAVARARNFAGAEASSGALTLTR